MMRPFSPVKPATHSVKLAVACTLLLVVRVAAAQAYEGMILDVQVNQQGRGEFTVYRSQDGDYFVRAADLPALGLRPDLPLNRSRIEGEDGDFISLRSLGVSAPRFDAKRLALEVELPGELFPTSERDLGARRRATGPTSSERSAIVNYRLSSSDNGSSSTPTNVLAMELNLRLNEVLFHNEAQASSDAPPRRFVTQFVYDRVAHQQRYTLGDFSAASGDLGSTLALGGLNLSKIYQMAPDLVRQPVAGFAGVATTPSRVEVRIGGVPVATSQVGPGPFELQNLRQYGGARDVDVVVRDAFGREQSYAFPFYFSDQSLRAGLHEYSYSLGRVRLDAGSDTDRYGALAFSAFHQYGYSDTLTLGARAEAASELYNAGVQATLRHDQAGVFSGAVSLGNRSGQRGAATSFSYTYQQPRFAAQAIARNFTAQYAPLEDLLSPFRGRAEYGASLSWFVKEGASVNINRNMTALRDQPASQVASVSYSQRVGGNGSAFVTLQRNQNDAGSVNQILAGFYLAPERKHNVSVNANRSDDGTRNFSMLLSRSVPPGEGFGYRVGWNEAGAVQAQDFTSYLQWNAPAFSLSLDTGDTRAPDSSSRRREVAAFGAVAYAGGAWGLSRLINDSFAIVRVGDGLQGVPVLANSQEVGRSNRSGQLVVNDLGSYNESRVSISLKDIPLEYSVPREKFTVTPTLRSGVLLDFGVRRMRALAGTIRLGGRFGKHEADNLPVRLVRGGVAREFMTGREGRYYVEDIAPGDYQGEIQTSQGRCNFKLSLPESQNAIVTMAEASVCE